MRFLENLLANLIRDATGINARRVIRRIGGKRLLLGGLAAAGAAALASRQGAQQQGSGAAAPGGSGAPAGEGGGYAFTKGSATGPAPAAPASPTAPTTAPATAPAMPPAASAAPPPPPPVTPLRPPSVPTAAAAPAVAAPPPPPAVPDSAAAPAPTAEAPAAPAPAAPAAGDAADELPPHLAYAAVRTMVAAALADGRLAPEEKAAIQTRLGQSGLDEAQVSQVHQDLVLPPTVEELAVLVTDGADREVLYQLAAVVLHSDQRVTDLERVWLGRLGKTFGLAEERCRILQDEVFAPEDASSPDAAFDLVRPGSPVPGT